MYDTFSSRLFELRQLHKKSVEEVAKEMDAQIVELLNTEIDIDIYTVDFDMFNYYMWSTGSCLRAY